MPAFTKNAIKESFIKLLDQKPMNQITVKDIVEDCGINRNSFYYHFADIPALFNELLTERTDQIIARYGTVETLEECVAAVVQFAEQDKRAILHAYRSMNRERVEEYLMRICRYTVERFIETAIGEVTVREEDREIMICFFQCECFGQAIAWLNSGMSYDMEAQFCRLSQLLHGMVEGLVRRCEEEAKREGLHN